MLFKKNTPYFIKDDISLMVHRQKIKGGHLYVFAYLDPFFGQCFYWVTHTSALLSLRENIQPLHSIDELLYSTEIKKLYNGIPSNNKHIHDLLYFWSLF